MPDEHSIWKRASMARRVRYASLEPRARRSKHLLIGTKINNSNKKKKRRSIKKKNRHTLCFFSLRISSFAFFAFKHTLYILCVQSFPFFFFFPFLSYFFLFPLLFRSLVLFSIFFRFSINIHTHTHAINTYLQSGHEQANDARISGSTLSASLSLNTWSFAIKFRAQGACARVGGMEDVSAAAAAAALCNGASRP